MRWILVFRGGQYFFPDENRYHTSQLFVRLFLDGDFSSAVSCLGIDHLGFKIVGVLPASLEIIFGNNPLIPALFFSMFSVINIVLIWFISQRTGADRIEGLWAAFLLSVSNVFFYYSSHLLPYDLAMAFALTALAIGVSQEFGKIKSLWTGFFVFLCFISYNGYWTIALCVLMIHILIFNKTIKNLIGKLIYSGLGFSLPILLFYFLGQLFLGNNILLSYLSFASGITQGSFSEGAIFPIRFLWASEGLMFILWLILLTCSLLALTKHHPQRILLWFGGIFVIYNFRLFFSGT